MKLLESAGTQLYVLTELKSNVQLEEMNYLMVGGLFSLATALTITYHETTYYRRRYIHIITSQEIECVSFIGRTR